MFPRSIAFALSVLLLALSAGDLAVPGFCQTDDSSACGSTNSNQVASSESNCLPIVISVGAKCPLNDQLSFHQDCFCCGKVIPSSSYQQQIDQSKFPSLDPVTDSPDIQTVFPIHHPPRSV